MGINSTEFRENKSTQFDKVRGGNKMKQLNSLFEVRDDLLREYILASGAYKAEILNRIIDLDEEIELLNN
jgi:hypothetical protein